MIPTPSFMVMARGCAPPISPSPAVSTSFPLQGPTEMLPGTFGQGFVGSLEDPLGPNIDPRASGHLAVHGEAQSLQFPEFFPGGPLRNEHGVHDEDPRRILVGLEDGHGPSRLNHEGFVVLEFP
jgi:hypothetical protein